MIKRTLTLIVILLALSVSSALAASGNPAPVCSIQAAPASGRRLTPRLKKIDGRIVGRIAKIKERCGAAPTGADAKKCGHADEAVQRLRTLQDKVKQLEQKLQTWLDQGPAAGGTGSGGSGLESLDRLAADLAAVQAQAGN
jgi:hypothetical protein